MEKIENWYTNRGLTPHQFQIEIVGEKVDNAFKLKDEAVLAAAPSAGKTLMSICYIDNYLKDHSNHRVLVLTHGTTTLRTQYYEEVIKCNPQFTYRNVENGKDILNSKENVIITLPQTIVGIKNKSNFDLLIVDEGHQFYFAEKNGIDGMVKRIKKSCNIKKTLILTGSPSPFIFRGYNIIPVTIEKLLENDFITDPRIEIGTSAYNFTYKDYNQDDEIKNDVSFIIKETNITLDDLLEKIVSKLKSVFKNIPSVYSSLITNVGWSFPLLTLKKTMIVCRSIEQGHQVEEYFKNKNINVVLSTSDIDIDSDEIKKFQKDKNILVLIVVGRGILGFNYPELVNVIDMSCSQNLDRIFQLLCRVIRKHPAGDQKLFFKVVPSNLEQYFEHLMSAVMCLTNEEYYLKYNGKNFLDLEFPTLGTKKIKNKNNNVDKKEKRIVRQNLKMWDIPAIKFFNSLIHKNNEVLNTVYWTTLRKVKNEFFSDRELWFVLSDDELLEKLKTIVNEKKWLRLQDFMCTKYYNILMDRGLTKQFSDLNIGKKIGKLWIIMNYSKTQKKLSPKIITIKQIFIKNVLLLEGN